jgi:hypothetical protein
MWPNNTQMASLGRQVTQKEAKGVNNAMARDNVQWYCRGYRPCLRWCQNGEGVIVDVEFVAMMSGGDVDVEPSLVSRNTLENGEPQLKILNKIVKIGLCCRKRLVVVDEEAIVPK